MSFDMLMQKHRSLVRTLAKPWAKRCMAYVSLSDLEQEVWITAWKAIAEWDPSRSDMKLGTYVRQQIHYRLLRYTAVLVKERYKESKFLMHQIIEEHVVVVSRSADADSESTVSYEAVAPDLHEATCDARRLAARVIGALPSKQARIVASVVNGQETHVIAEQVYGPKKRRRKAALRAIAAALTLVEVYEAQDGERYPDGPTQSNPDADPDRNRLKPVRKVVESDARERQQSAAAG